MANAGLDHSRRTGADLPGAGDWRYAATQECGPSDEQAMRLAEILDQYLADLQAGKAPDRTRLVADHPELAGELEACLAGIDFIHETGSGPERSPERVLGPTTCGLSRKAVRFPRGEPTLSNGPLAG